MLVMSPERPPSSDGGPALESPNMVLSSIPIESGHVLQQQHHQQIQQQQYHQSISHAITNGNFAYATSPSSTTSSKLLVLQPNQLNDSYITTNDSNAVGNIVLLATEQMEIGSVEHNGVHSNSTTDEELTSLTWLHDKNLLKVNNLGINLTCTNGNAIKTIDENSPPRRKNSGAISPTSDFLDDSCVSEDNASSANSLSEGISIYSTETTIPTSYQFVNNNNSINKNRNQMPTSTTQVIQLGPAGTVIEYMTTNLQGKINTALQQTSNTSTVITSTSTTVTATPTHQHFHKKYLREEHNKTLKEMTEANVSSSPVKLEHNSSSNYDTTSSIISEKDYQGTPVRQQINRTEPSSPDSYSSPTNQTQNQKQSPHKLKHPTNMPYDPLIHTNNKPPLSFSSLIFLAIEDSIEKALPVKEIYAWIVAHYPYFKTAPTGWKNSVRHNLSLNKCFQKVEKAPNMGKGSLWRVEQQYKQNLIQALTRSSYHPCSNSLEKSPFKVSPRPAESPPGFKPGTRPLDADLFPRLSKFMAEMVSNDDTPSPPGTPIEDDYHQQIYNNNNNNSSSNKNVILSVATGGHIVYNNERIARDWGVDSIDDVNAATAMLALKHGPKVFNESFRNGHPPIITSSPSEDHTYSAGGLGSKRSSNNNSDNNSNGTSSDAAYESSEESHTNNILTKEELEARHHAEGVDAFLTFATEVSSMSSPIKRPPSPDSYNGSYAIPIGYYESPVIHHNNNNHFAYLSSPPPPKKSRSRTLRTKLKKKAWLR
ncbi:uncharacterized protein LOC119085200 isoform X2 [Bradysia coprophila]|uniref:uncharacterized protein LOC119085200 isoform X2 n=2 Tax=Bradysia coprophila TaxID=38358 RepID=UPI00187DB046|nr:uncharacterized protein LOC119085200 isoform X2 [Bradysia coprophila]